MLKLLEKPPFSRWRFVQRILHRQRNNKNSGAERFKTFDKSLAPKSESTSIVEHDGNAEYDDDEHEIEVRQRPQSKMKASKTEPNGFTKLTNDEGQLRRCHSDETFDVINDEEEEEIDTTEVTKDPPASLGDKVEQAKGSAARIKAWEESHTADSDLIESNAEKIDQVQYNSLSIRRTSKLRRSLRELKSRSKTRVDNMRHSMRRSMSSRKYDHLDKEEEEEILSYDTSPGSKRRQVIEL